MRTFFLEPSGVVLEVARSLARSVIGVVHRWEAVGRVGSAFCNGRIEPSLTFYVGEEA